ncbi:MAG: alkaline phosphatase [Phycisphaeraceae bacterium]|nr:alkaline phosphatase [Phycisphaeraceae bacterium]MCW5762377.1 alkaline phosphatase [Phycisphaeraceae bacterium]
MRHGLGRREFLGIGAAGGLLAVGPALGRAPTVRPARAGTARNVIFMVSDGMSQGTLTIADVMLRRVHGRGSHWAELWLREGSRRSVMQTYSADALVTDSAAAGSAWGIGEHVHNGAINVTPDGRKPEPLLVTASKAGKATGLVTTTRVTHATPASFIANVASRSSEQEIADQIIERKVDVVLGGGAQYFADSVIARDPDLRVVRTAKELADMPKEGRVLGLFQNSHMSYTLDREAHEPTLADMTREALERLGSRAGGFVLQVEGGRVDHAAHSNDACALIHDQIAFDDAIGEAVRFASSRDDTLLIVTTDHGNANPGFTLGRSACNRGLERIAQAKHSLDWVSAQVSSGPQDEAGLVSTAAQALHAATGATLTKDEEAWVSRTIIEKARVDGFNAANGTTGSIGALLANHLAVAFLSPNHTSDMCEVTALGPGAELVKPFIDNIDLHTIALQALALAERP